MLTQDVARRLISQLQEILDTASELKSEDFDKDKYVAFREDIRDLFYGNAEVIDDILGEEAVAGLETGEQYKNSLNRNIDRAIRRLESVPNLPTDPAFDTLIERRIDAAVEKNTLVKWVRLLATAGLTAAAVVGGGVGGFGTWFFIRDFETVKDQAVQDINLSKDKAEQEINLSKASAEQAVEALEDKIKQGKEDIDKKTANFDQVVTKKVEAQVAEYAGEAQKRLKKDLASLESVESEIPTIRAKITAVDTTVVGFAEEMNNWIKAQRLDYQGRFNRQFEDIALSITNHKSFINDRLDAFDQNAVEPHFAGLTHRLEGHASTVASFEKQADEEIARIEAQLDDVAKEINGIVDRAVDKVDSTVATQTPDAVKRVDTAVNDSISNLISQLNSRTETALAEATKVVDTSRSELATQLALAKNSMTDSSKAVLQGWDALQQQVSGAADAAIRKIGGAAETAAQLLSETVDSKLKGAPERIYSLEEVVTRLNDDIGDRKQEIDELGAKAGSIEQQIGAFKAVQKALDDEEVTSLSSEQLQLSISVIENTFYVALFFFALSVVASSVVAWLISRKKAPSTPAEAAS